MIDGAYCIHLSSLLAPILIYHLISPLHFLSLFCLSLCLTSLQLSLLFTSLFAGVSKVIELEKFLSSGGSPSDIRTLLRAERLKAETECSKGEVGGEAEAVEEAEVVLEVDMTAGA
jgi:hypothetical protein